MLCRRRTPPAPRPAAASDPLPLKGVRVVAPPAPYSRHRPNSPFLPIDLQWGDLERRTENVNHVILGIPFD